MKKNLLAAVLVFGFGSSALAASPDDGTITLTGQAAKMVSIKFTSATTHSFTADLATAMDDTAVKSPDFAFELRSNVPYTLSASVDGSASGTGNEVAPADITYAFTDLVGNGALVSGVSDTTPTRTDAIPAAKKTGTLATFNGTAGTTITTGNRISNKGGFSAPNDLKGKVNFSLAPQFFAPAVEFNYAVTLTIASQ